MARSPAKRVIGTLLFVLALLAVLAFYFIVFADAQNIRDVPATEFVPEIAIGSAILLGIVVLVLFLMLVIRKRDQEPEAPAEDAFFVPDEGEPEPVPEFAPEPEPEPEPVFEDEGDGMVVYDVWRLPVARRAWGADNEPHVHSFYFPLSVESGVYVNDYIPLDDDPHGDRLKLRTLLAGPKDFQAVSFTIPDEEPLEETDESPPEWGSSPVRPPRPRRDESRGDDFMRELERRFEERQAERAHAPGRAAVPERTVAVTTDGDEVYYDFTGDVHDVIDVEGIGGAYAGKLRDAGIQTTARLCYEDPVRLASVTGAPRKTVASWQAMAEMMKINGIGPQYAEALARAGISGIDELKRRSPKRIADQVNEYLDGLDANVLGSTISERRVAGWQARAKSMRRVRQRIPEN